ncbi:MAG: twin-arginine translocase subunit TatC [Candidatus Omnitrophica bacterium]|nr:twin-arginine translocase subunit TatC [Candidatus Omnitrophota bacterium]
MTKRSELAPFWDHVDELRSRMLISLVAVAIAAIVFYQVVDPVLRFVIKPVGRLVFTSPADAFIARLLLTALGGFIIAMPIVLYQTWVFIALGLREKEKKFVRVYGPLSVLFFFAGLAFAYYVALPISLKFLLGFSSDWLVPMITVKSYVTFFMSLVLAFGVIFELPIILIFLTAIGIATPEFLVQKRRHAIVIILIVSAVITPPDIITLLIMTLPLVFLYEIGLMASRITYRRKLSKG